MDVDLKMRQALGKRRAVSQRIEAGA